MTIGIDLSSLQSGHRMRGIGYTLINFINHLSASEKAKHHFVFYYTHDSALPDPLEPLELDGVSYEVRELSVKPPAQNQSRFPFSILTRVLNAGSRVFEMYRGDPRIHDFNKVDIFLQTDQMVSLPKANTIKSVMIAYDVIPYVLEWDYLWNYRTARAHGYPVKAALRCAFLRWKYIEQLRLNAGRAHRIITISDATKLDFKQIIGAKPHKMKTIPLGISGRKPDAPKEPPQMRRYYPSSWGYLPKPYDMDRTTPFLLFVGGADSRRKLDDLVLAFNHLRARGHDLKLVLAGDTMQGPQHIPTLNIQRALRDSSYIDDIIFMGFVTDAQRDWLYENALVFVYPSVYEGFGLPVLEAMSYGTPVICYDNQAIREVAGNHPTYADSPFTLRDAIARYLHSSASSRHAESKANVAHSETFLWSTTTRLILHELKTLNK